MRELPDRGTVVLRLPNWVGDAVMATPALRALRAHRPRLQIVALATKPVRRLLQQNRTVDRWIDVERKERHRGLVGWVRLVREIRAASPSASISFPHSFSSAWLGFAAGARIRLGFHTRERACLLTHAPRPPAEGTRRLPRPMTAHYLDLLAALGVPGLGERLELVTTDDERAQARVALTDLGLAADEPYCAVNPGAAFGASKFWTVDAFQDTIRGIESEFGWRTLVLCGPGEESLAREIASGVSCAIDTSQQVIPLELLKPVLAGARLLVTTDTGPRHIATAFDVPTVVVMGPTDPRYTNSNLDWTRVLRVDVDCGPCHLKVCPLDHRCMTQLTAAQAVAAARELVTRPARPVSESQHA